MGCFVVGVVGYWVGSYCGCCLAFVWGSFAFVAEKYLVFGYSAFPYSMGGRPIGGCSEIGFVGVAGC